MNDAYERDELDDDGRDPLTPDNPLAIPLVDTLRDLVRVKTELQDALYRCGGYRLLLQLALTELRTRELEVKAARQSVERLRDELTSMRMGKAA